MSATPQQNIIDFILSGGGANTSKSASLGGWCSELSAGIIQSNAINNFFDHVTRSRMIAGEYQYMCAYIHVKSNTDDLPSARFWLDRDTPNDENEFAWSLEVDMPSSKYKYSPYKTYNGTSDADVLADAASLDLVQHSCSAWFRTSKNYTTTGVIVIKNNFNVHNYGLWIDANEKILGGFRTAGVDHFAISPLSYNDDKWHHAVVTYDSVTVRLYIDGAEVATHVTSATPDVGSGSLTIGRNADVADRYWEGDLDEVYIWNDDLTAGEVTNLYNIGRMAKINNIVHFRNFGPTQGNYKFAPHKHFDGASYTEQADSSSLDLSQFTIACWFLTAYSGGNDMPIITKGVFGSEVANDNHNYHLYMQASDKHLRGGFETSAGTDRIVTGNSVVNDYKWHHAVVTYSGANVRLYLDGYEDGTTVATADTPNTNTHPLRIGRDGGSVFADGTYIDEIYVLNDDVGAQDVQEWYNEGPEVGLAGFEGNIIYEQHYGNGDDNGSRIAQQINSIFREPEGMSWQGQDSAPDIPNLYVRDLKKYTNSGSYGSIYPIWFRRRILPNSSDSVDNKGLFKLTGFLRRKNAPVGGETPDDDGGSKPPDDVEEMMFGAVGDTDCKSMTDTVFSQMDKKGVMMPLFLGDINYKSDRDCIKSKIKKYWRIGGFGDENAMIVIGNHDDESGKMKDWISDFKLTSQGCFFHIHENVAIIGMNSEVSFSTSSSQYDFIKKSLESADKNSHVDWIIVMIHRPFISADSNHSPNEGNKADIYMPLFTKYHVDIVLQAHNHNMQRSKFVKDKTSDHENPTVVESSSPFTKGRGMVVYTVGTGGHDSGGDLYGIDNTPSWQGYSNDNDNGFLFLHFMGTNNDQCELTLYDESGDELDQVMIE